MGRKIEIANLVSFGKVKEYDVGRCFLTKG